MTKHYLVFRLYGPMASWGQAAVGGERPTGQCPSRSALLGLLGAVLGIKRDNEAALQQLQSSVGFGIKQYAPGSLMRDYHTAQVPSEDKKMVHRTRKSELSVAKLNTVLSSRDYRCDGLWVVAVWLTQNSHYSLEQLKQALLTPVYPLCLGRKSCPPALPLLPKVVEHDDLRTALDDPFPAIVQAESDPFWLNLSAHPTYFWEGDPDAIGGDGRLTSYPWDEPLHRGRWQFKQRAMYQITVMED